MFLEGGHGALGEVKVRAEPSHLDRSYLGSWILGSGLWVLGSWALPNAFSGPADLHGKSDEIKHTAIALNFDLL